MHSTTNTSRCLRLGDILVEQGVISKEQLDESLGYQKETGIRLGEALTDLGYMTPQRLENILSWQSMYGVAALSEIAPNPSALGVLTETFCRARHILPLDFDRNGALVLAMLDPADIVTIDDVRLITGLEVTPVTATQCALNEAFTVAFSQRGRLESAAPTDGPQEPEPEIRRLAEYSKVISLVEEIIAAAIRQNASDIHLEPQADRTTVRVRVDGVLHHLTDVRKELKEGVVSRIKILGDMDIAERRLPQDGRATFRLKDHEVDLRIACLPTVFGENVTIRLLDTQAANITLEDMGMGESELERFRKALKRPWGEILVTGPTGSGKSTTLYAGLEELSHPGIKVYTVEDPVERQMPGIMQSQVRANIGLTFASMLRSLVRSDPDVIMIGEIRDYETALVATEASLTGHLVLSTLHTNDAASAITRLMEMGIPAYLIASALECVVAQRLTRRLCPHCLQAVTLRPSKMAEAEKHFFGPHTVEVAEAVGCNFCFNTGYLGRVGLFEVLPVSREIRRLILEQASADDLRDAAKQAGTLSLREDGRRKVLAKVTTMAEVERVTA
jgi:type IV pilus assembly protein PilB